MSACVTSEGQESSYHVLIQSVVDAATIEELKIASKDPGGAFATLLQWITIRRASKLCAIILIHIRIITVMHVHHIPNIVRFFFFFFFFTRNTPK
jgi:hypothetical protein